MSLDALYEPGKGFSEIPEVDEDWDGESVVSVELFRKTKGKGPRYFLTVAYEDGTDKAFYFNRGWKGVVHQTAVGNLDLSSVPSLSGVVEQQPQPSEGS